jgi:uncharacterized protein
VSPCREAQPNSLSPGLGNPRLAPDGKTRHLSGSVLDARDETMSVPDLDEPTRIALEAAAFRRLVGHLRERSDVQNIDLMILAGFCRNCLSRWYREAAEERGLALADADAREIIYGMPYKEWQSQHQKEATPEQQAAFARAQTHAGS